MKAAQIHEYGSPSVINISDIPKPSPADDQVLVEVKATSLNPFDTTIREGYMREMIPLTFPTTLGGDLSGTVIEVGQNVTSLSVGDTVYGQANVVAGNSGAFAEFATTHASQVTLKPTNLSFEEAAALPLAGVSALQALGEHLNLQKDQKLFIHGGAGGIGSLAIQIAKYIGAHIATTARPEDNEYVTELGADEVIDYTNKDFAEVLSDYDAVFDTVGGEDFAKTFQILKPGGKAVSMIAKPDEALASELKLEAQMQSTGVNTERLTKLAELVEAGAVKPQIAKTFPLDNISEAFTERETGHSRGKIVIILP